MDLAWPTSRGHHACVETFWRRFPVGAANSLANAAECAEGRGNRLFSHANRNYLIRLDLRCSVVEARGVEPVPGSFANRLMAHDFRCNRLTLCCHVPVFESPGVPWSPLQSWRHFGDEAGTLTASRIAAPPQSDCAVHRPFSPSAQLKSKRISPLSFAASGLAYMRIRE